MPKARRKRSPQPAEEAVVVAEAEAPARAPAERSPKQPRRPRSRLRARRRWSLARTAPRSRSRERPRSRARWPRSTRPASVRPSRMPLAFALAPPQPRKNRQKAPGQRSKAAPTGPRVERIPAFAKEISPRSPQNQARGVGLQARSRPSNNSDEAGESAVSDADQRTLPRKRRRVPPHRTMGREIDSENESTRVAYAPQT